MSMEIVDVEPCCEMMWNHTHMCLQDSLAMLNPMQLQPTYSVGRWVY